MRTTAVIFYINQIDLFELKPNQILNIESYGQKIILENACVVGEWPNNVFCLHFEGLFYSINDCCIYFGVDSPRGPSLRRAGNTNLISVYLWVSCAFTAKVVIDLRHKPERTVFSQKRLFSGNGSWWKQSWCWWKNFIFQHIYLFSKAGKKNAWQTRRNILFAAGINRLVLRFGLVTLSMDLCICPKVQSQLKVVQQRSSACL